MCIMSEGLDVKQILHQLESEGLDPRLNQVKSNGLDLTRDIQMDLECVTQMDLSDEMSRHLSDGLDRGAHT